MSEATTASEAFERWRERWTPEATATRAAETAAKRRSERDRQRATVSPVALTLEALLDKMGWSREYAEHLVQPYCDCGEGWDGWLFCSHANDLGWPDKRSPSR